MFASNSRAHRHHLDPLAWDYHTMGRQFPLAHYRLCTTHPRWVPPPINDVDDMQNRYRGLLSNSVDISDDHAPYAPLG
ncbi:hypothetical protein HME01_06000 [Vreelandella aquamarina]|uniref:Uncharacterized protein n=3 Tax=Halomonadaceae TaxID=28256 RepID=A0A6F8XDQ8_9GAMM|nr:hypothetical protein HAALTHF_06910n [Halomonas axialensis]BCA90364.1 hypothetical protein HMSLTHF_01390 [Halomonas meridiana]BCB09700.1 hypothetical protein HHSLTHF2_35900 [Halomonas hydrothermalis]GGW53102.1 hypothetical protein GCM10007158_13040 [Halomonas johnsoniae]BCB72248.1 hypothetical protein HMEPL2_25990 [Halomonas meridiana]